MSVTKKFTKGSKGKAGSEKCRVTFKVSQKLAEENQAQAVRLAGTFNNWGKEEPEKYAMAPLKGGAFSVTLTLPAHQEYLFKYVITKSNGEEVWVIDDDESVETRFSDFANSFLSTEIE